MLGAEAVVISPYGGQTIPHEDNPTEGVYHFEHGEIGILRWKPSPCGTVLDFQPEVIWDADPKLLPRRVLLVSIELIGLQINGCRFFCGPKPTLQDAH